MAADTPTLAPAVREVPRMPVAQHWSVQLRDILYTYLPLLLMLVLAGATWWLVRVTPLPPLLHEPQPSAQAPDYTLMGVDLQRYRADGSLLARIRGRELRHFPQGDRLELEDADILWHQMEGPPITALARRADVTEGGDRTRLTGSVVLRRPVAPGRSAVEVRGEEIEYDAKAARAWSNRPVEWVDDQGVVRAAGFDYRQEEGQVLLKGPVRTEWRAAAAGGR